MSKAAVFLAAMASLSAFSHQPYLPRYVKPLQRDEIIQQRKNAADDKRARKLAKTRREELKRRKRLAS